MKIDPPKKQAVKALLAHGKSIAGWAEPISGKKRFTAHAANSFLLGVMFDRSIKAERAWQAAEWFNDSIGDPSDPGHLWREVAKMPRVRLLGFLRYGYGGKAFHRHYKTFARQLPEAAEILLNEYAGDPRRIWRAQSDVPLVRARLEKLPGIGPALSRMTVLILARNRGALGGRTALAQLDVKPDIHVMRVFTRLGLLSAPNAQDAIAAARYLQPEFPGGLDAPAFDIGRNWCFLNSPDCASCPVQYACPTARGT